jgi:DNA end-binding protein Ku
MLSADEIRDPKGIDSAQRKTSKPKPAELKAAVAVIEGLSCEWDPESYKDRYRARLKKVVDRKRKGETIKIPDAADDIDAPADLMEALERTLAEMSS